MGSPPVGVDVVARMLQEPWRALGTRLVMDSRRARAATSLRSGVQSRADGYTLLLARCDARRHAALYRKLPFDVEADFTPIAPLVECPRAHRQSAGDGREVVASSSTT